jgi:hypothetical protein
MSCDHCASFCELSNSKNIDIIA